ncbi:MAG: ABC transporter substrate-binding protein [Spirochaetales bacterium]|nr:ABC transporter substrate-binding protein [Spirochaetales bacterium]
MKFHVRFIILLLSVCIAGSLSASGQSEEAGDGPVEIQFWYAFSDAPRSGWIQDRIAEWNTMNPDFVVVGERKGSYRETLQAAVLAARQGEPPHLVQLFEVGSQLAVDSGIFKPVGEVGGVPVDDYIEPVLNYYTIDDEVYSIPFNSSSPILYTNRDKMRAAGLDPHDPPETFGEVIAMLEQAREAGVEGARIGFNLHSWFFEQWMAQQGAALVNNDNGRAERADEVNLTSEAAYRIVEWIDELNRRGLYTYTGRLEDWSGSDAIFQEGEAMFHITSTADLGNIGSAVAGVFEMGTGLLPIPDGVERNGVVIGGASVWLLDGHTTPELEAARDFVLYMTNTENMVSWHKLTGYYPVRNSSVDALEAEGWFEEFPEATIAFTQLLETTPNQATAGALMGSFLDTRTIVGEAIQRVLQGADVEEAMEAAKVLADDRLREYNANL